MTDAKTTYDYLIVGQGLAGTTLAMHLLAAGKKICIVQDSTLPSSSRVAAGIFNPLTGKKLVKTWLADDLFPYAQNFYQAMEEKLDARFIYNLPIYRPFRSIEEQNTYLAQTADPSILPYIAVNDIETDVSAYVYADHGGLEVTKSGWVDLPLFLDKSKQYLEHNACYYEVAFDVEDLEIEAVNIRWNGLIFDKVILCQGFEATKNHLFDWLPFAPVKGEVLEIATDDILKPYIINQGIFMLPYSENRCRVGATYAWNNLNWEITDHARTELEEELKNLFKKDYKVVDQLAGIRPSSNDRRPIIGMHPHFSNVGILNGLGTKGVTLAPFFANQLVNNLEYGKELNPLVNIKRYFSLYFR